MPVASFGEAAAMNISITQFIRKPFWGTAGRIVTPRYYKIL